MLHCREDEGYGACEDVQERVAEKRKWTTKEIWSGRRGIEKLLERLSDELVGTDPLHYIYLQSHLKHPPPLLLVFIRQDTIGVISQKKLSGYRCRIGGMAGDRRHFPPFFPAADGRVTSDKPGHKSISSGCLERHCSVPRLAGWISTENLP